MIPFIRSFLPAIPDLLAVENNMLESFLQGLVSASGITVLCNIMRIHLFVTYLGDHNGGDGTQNSKSTRGVVSVMGGGVQFCCLTGILTLLGSRVTSLVVLEFSIRAVSTWITTGLDSPPTTLQFLLQSQFSLGCALSCSLHFLQEEAPQRLLSLFLAAGLSWFLVSQSTRLWCHVSVQYPLHSNQRYCGVCIGLLTSGHTLPPLLCRSLLLIFSVALIAAIYTINQYFLSAAEALRFWTPVTICYTLMVVYKQEEQRCFSGGEEALQTVTVRLGGLLLVMLTVGCWTDVLHVFICFLGELCCMLQTQDLQQVIS